MDYTASMSDSLTVKTRAIGRKKRLLDDWSVPPPDDASGGDPFTLRALLTHVVTETVRAFERRQEQNKFVRVLTQKQIEEQAERGKIDSGGRDLDQKVNLEDAIANALQSFEDGIYLVILDGVEQRDLDAQVFLKPDSQLTFLRLVMLAGA